MSVSFAYLISILLSIVALMILIYGIDRQRKFLYILMFTTIVFVNMSYFAMSISRTTEEALLANKFSCIDGTFLTLLLLLCTMDICRIPIRTWFVLPLFTLGIFFLGLIFSVGYTDVFYTSVQLEINNDIVYLAKEFGPLYYAYATFEIMYMILPMICVGFSFFHRARVSYKYTMCMALIQFFTIGTYFVEMVLGVKYELLPFTFVISEYIILIVLARMNMYDVATRANQANTNQKKYGYAIFDLKLNYVGADDIAKFYFPQFDQLSIDRPVQDPFIKERFVDWISQSILEERPGSTYFTRGETTLKCTFTPLIYEKTERTLGYIVAIQDDTEQQKNLAALNTVNRKLSEAVFEAQKANSAKSAFLANMSHEIRTPINAILGMSEIALRDCADEDTKDALRDIREAGDSLLAIVNDILDFSKIEAGRMDVIEDRYYLGDLIKEIQNMVQLKANEKGLALRVDVEEDLPNELYGDANRVRQMIVNLLNNAVKYTQSGSVTLTIRQEKRSAKLIKLWISVADTGIGIKPEDMGKLFSSFQRFDQKANKGIEGTGLGLALTKRIVELMGGTINVESIYGEGSCFSIHVSQRILGKETYAEGKDIDHRKEKKEEHPVFTAPEAKVLVVDDNAVNLRVMQGLLKPTQVQVTCASSGDEALMLMRKEKFEVVFLDHMMPEKDGIETLWEARGMEGNLCKGSSFIALTANAIAGVRERYLEASFDDYISKPIDSTVLIEMVEKYIKKQSGVN